MAISNKYSTARPSLYLNFYKSRQLDPRISVSRASTGTYIDAEGIVRTADANEPRFNYENGECKGLLVEKSTTNAFLNTNTFTGQSTVSNTGGTGQIQWFVNAGGTLTTNATTAPDGTNTATLAVINTSSGYVVSNAAFAPTILQGNRICLSVFVKPHPDNTANVFTLYQGGGSDYGVSFNVSSSGTSQTLTDGYSIKLANGWYRLVINRNVTSGGAMILYWNNRTTDKYYIWGAQGENSAVATSYISATSSAVTRAADKVTINDLSWFNDTEGTFMVATGPLGINTTTTLFSVDNGSSQIIYNRNKVKVGTGRTIYSPIITSDDTQRIVGYSSSKNVVITSSSDEPAFFSTTTSLPTGMNRLAIGWDPLNSNNYLNGPIKSLRYYPTLLDDTQLKSLVKINQDQTIEEVTTSSYIGIGTTTGLVLNLDSSDPSSYSPETNIWYDLSGNNNHATLYNSPIYSSSGGGSIRFDTSQYGYVSPSATTTFDASTSYTISLWFQLNESSRSGLDTLFEGNGGARIWMYVSGDNYLTFNTYYGPPNPAGGYYNDYYQGIGYVNDLNTWYNAVVIHDKTNLKQRTYLNGNLTSEITLLSGYSFVTNSGGGFYINNGVWGPAGSKFGIVQVYNRVLSNTEISNHVNNLRDRFGI